MHEASQPCRCNAKQITQNKTTMKRTSYVLVLLLVMCVFGASGLAPSDDLTGAPALTGVKAMEQPATDQSPEVRWGSHIFDRAGLQYLERAPWDLSQLPSQVASIGLNSERVVFAQKSTAFGTFREQFEQALQHNPVSSEAITDWQASHHGGMTVHTRIYKVNNLGIGVAFMQPHVIFVDLGPADEAVANRNRLVQMNL